MDSLILDFARFLGYQEPVSDQSMEERVTVLKRRYGLSQRDAFNVIEDLKESDLERFFQKRLGLSHNERRSLFRYGRLKREAGNDGDASG